MISMKINNNMNELDAWAWKTVEKLNNRKREELHHMQFYLAMPQLIAGQGEKNPDNIRPIVNVSESVTLPGRPTLRINHESSSYGQTCLVVIDENKRFTITTRTCKTRILEQFMDCSCDHKWTFCNECGAATDGVQPCMCLNRTAWIEMQTNLFTGQNASEEM